MEELKNKKCFNLFKRKRFFPKQNSSFGFTTCKAYLMRLHAKAVILINNFINVFKNCFFRLNSRTLNYKKISSKAFTFTSIYICHESTSLSPQHWFACFRASMMHTDITNIHEYACYDNITHSNRLIKHVTLTLLY